MNIKNKIIELTKQSSKPSTSLRSIKKELINQYNGNPLNKKITEIAYCILHDTINNKCKICDKEYKFISFDEGYKKYCSLKCESLRDDNIKDINLLETFILNSNSKSIQTLTSDLLNQNLISSLYFHTSFLERKSNISERIYVVKNKIKSKPLCSNCKKHTVKFKSMTSGYFTYCDSKCSFEDTKLDRKNTNLLRYGSVNTFQSDVSNKNRSIAMKKNEVKEKIYNTREERNTNNKVSKLIKDYWNDKSIEEREKHFEKIKKGRLKKYGDENYVNIEKIKETRLRNTLVRKIRLIRKLGYTPLFTIEDYKGVVKEKYRWSCNKCKTNFSHSLNNGIYPSCPKCNKNKVISKPELEVGAFLKSLNVEFISNDRTLLKGLEVDYLIKSKDLAIEFNGSYYHSYEQLNKKASIRVKSLLKEHKLGSNVGIYYHTLKTKMAAKENVKLIHINEYEWNNPIKQNIWKSILKYKLNLIDHKIFARKCEIREVPNEDSYDFLEENHLQGNRASSIRLGLYYKEELVSLMTFGKGTFKNNTYIDIYRFCSKINTVVVGGAEKIFKYFIKKYNPKIMMTFSDRRFSHDSFYTKLGFKLNSISRPDVTYVKNNNVYRREKFQKKKLKALYDKGFLSHHESYLTADENMKLNNYSKIYDCGNYKFIWKKK